MVGDIALTDEGTTKIEPLRPFSKVIFFNTAKLYPTLGNRIGPNKSNSPVLVAWARRKGQCWPTAKKLNIDKKNAETWAWRRCKILSSACLCKAVVPVHQFCLSISHLLLSLKNIFKNIMQLKIILHKYCTTENYFITCWWCHCQFSHCTSISCLPVFCDDCDVAPFKCHI